MAEDGKVIYVIEGDPSRALKAIDKFEKAARESGEDVEKSSKESAKKIEDTVEKTSKSMEGSVTSAATKIAKAIGSAFAVKKVIEFGKAAVGVASDLNEVQNVVDTTFGTAGAIKINEWAKNAAEAFGESELQAKQFTSTLGAMFKSMGVGQADMEEMSMSLAGLAGDMASFYNLDPTEAFEKLRSGISGETEPLKQLGINMSVVNLEAFAMSEGITKSYQEMTQAEQATLRYQYIMSATADAQGDFADTSDSLANQQRILQLEIQTLAAEIGQDLMPIAQEMLSDAKDAIEWAIEHKDSLEKLAVAVIGVTGAYKLFKAALEAKALYDEVIAGIKAMNAALAGEQGLTVALNTAESAAVGFGSKLASLGPEGAAVMALVAGSAAGIIAAESLTEALEEALTKQYEYMDSLTSLADYRANGLVDAGGRVDYKKAEQMQANGTFKRDNTVLGAAPGRNFTSMDDVTRRYKWEHPVDAISMAVQSKLASRHQSGEDFVMADWTPAYLDYGERVLTASENAKYTAMGGVDGMEQRMTSGGSGGGVSVPSKMELGLKVFPREMAHAITPYVIDELQAMGQWEDMK